MYLGRSNYTMEIAVTNIGEDNTSMTSGGQNVNCQGDQYLRPNTENGYLSWNSGIHVNVYT